MQDIKDRLKNLKKIIQEHDHAYYLLDDPLISDHEYDSLFQELKKIEWVDVDQTSKKQEQTTTSTH